MRGEQRPHPEVAPPRGPAQPRHRRRDPAVGRGGRSWARYAEGVDEQGEPIEVVDRLSKELTEIARRQKDEPLAFIQNRDLFGDLADNERFVSAYRSALASLHEKGAPSGHSRTYAASATWAVAPADRCLRYAGRVRNSGQVRSVSSTVSSVRA